MKGLKDGDCMKMFKTLSLSRGPGKLPKIRNLGKTWWRRGEVTAWTQVAEGFSINEYPHFSKLVRWVPFVQHTAQYNFRN